MFIFIIFPKNPIPTYCISLLLFFKLIIDKYLFLFLFNLVPFHVAVVRLIPLLHRHPLDPAAVPLRSAHETGLAVFVRNRPRQHFHHRRNIGAGEVITKPLPHHGIYRTSAKSDILGEALSSKHCRRTGDHLHPAGRDGQHDLRRHGVQRHRGVVHR